MKSVFENINETGKVFGIPILQPKAVRIEFDNWTRENHPRLWMFQCILIVTSAIGVYGWQTDKHPLMELLLYSSVIALMLTISILSRQYNKQAPEGLKRR